MSFTEWIVDTYINCEECRRVFPPEILQRGFTLYADHTNNYRFMMVLQNPLFGAKRRKNEKDEAEKTASLIERVKVHQKYFTIWLLSNSNREFTRRFLDLFRNMNLIEFTDQNKYLKEKFYDDFYVTDLIKYYCKTNEIKKIHTRHSVNHLFEEIKLVRPSLILLFDTRVWNDFLSESKNRYKLKPVEDQKEIKKKIDPGRSVNKLANIHDFLFRGRYSSGEEFFVEPLVHISSNARYMLLRDSYFNFMKMGLEGYVKEFAKTYKTWSIFF